MVNLVARCTKRDIIISHDSFEHLLNCLDNQKYIKDVNADAIGSLSKNKIDNMQKSAQGKIDNFNRQCRNLLIGVS